MSIFLSFIKFNKNHKKSLTPRLEVACRDQFEFWIRILFYLYKSLQSLDMRICKLSTPSVQNLLNQTIMNWGFYFT